MKGKVRVILLVNHEGEHVPFFTCKGWYGKVGGKSMYHAANRLRNGMRIENIEYDYVLNLGSGSHYSAEFFKETIDETEESLVRSFGSLQHAFDLESGRTM